MIYTDGTHLIADSIYELHRFAQKIRLKREWFQEHPIHPHYDLTTKRVLERAISKGAIVVTKKELVNLYRKIK
jgi:hypothetical protein